MEIEGFIEQVKLNCNISDARYWGLYSLCGMLMRMRELYRAEHSLEPWDPVPKEAIGEWIEARETLWESLENEELRPLELSGRCYDPFQASGLNRLLRREGLVYSGGYGRYGKPTFFLAVLERERELQGHHVYYAGRELCRDLSASAAMLQQGCIFIRIEPLRHHLWQRLQELRGGRTSGALKEALSICGISSGTVVPEERVHARVEEAAAEVTELLLLHELGEAFEDEEDWPSLLSNCTAAKAEPYVRGVKDLLADTSEAGPLRSIVMKRDRSLLGLYMILLDGVRKELFPEIMTAFEQLVNHDDWSAVEEARVTGYRRASRLRQELLRIWKERGEIEDAGALVRAGS